MHRPRTATCGHCGQSFVFHRCRQRQQIFCSRACTFAHRRLKIRRVCSQCGVEFFNKNKQKFCSNKCQGLHDRKPKVERKCARCGQSFYRQASDRDAVYCSRKCKHDSVLVTCSRCGKSVKRGKKQAGLARNYYCSTECLKNRVTIKCLHCDSIFIVKWHLRDTARFCSQQCMLRYEGETSIETMVRHAIEQLSLPYIQEHKLGGYFIDFYLPLFNLAIEADGEYWHSGTRKSRDIRRDAYLLSQGVLTIRLPEKVIKSTKDLPSLINRRIRKAVLIRRE